MKIGILGSGEVGKTLARGFLKYGYEVTIGSDHMQKLEEFKKENGKVLVGSFNETAAFGDIIVLAVKGLGAEKVVEEVKASLDGKVVIDTTNPLAEAPPEDGVLKLFTSRDESLMEKLQSLAPKARFVKAFSSIGSALMLDHDFGGSKPTMFICGNDEAAKQEVKKILEQFGFESEDMGGVKSARVIEPLVVLWCIPGFIRNDWTHAFKMLKK